MVISKQCVSFHEQVGPGYFPLPAWPMRVACSLGLDTDLGVTFSGNRSDVRYKVSLDGLEVTVDWDTTKSSGTPGPKLVQLAEAVGKAVDVWYGSLNVLFLLFLSSIQDLCWYTDLSLAM